MDCGYYALGNLCLGLKGFFGGNVMKRIICVLLVLIVALGMCGCAETQTVDGHLVDVFDDRFVVIENYYPGRYVVYDMTTKVVYLYDSDSYGGFLAPYQIYQDGVIYGAIWDQNEIKPAPYAMGLTLDMLGLASKYLD